jgi:uncharacterized lipoprotein YehR (DUF1307 family)
VFDKKPSTIKCLIFMRVNSMKIAMLVMVSVCSIILSACGNDYPSCGSLYPSLDEHMIEDPCEVKNWTRDVEVDWSGVDIENLKR